MKREPKARWGRLLSVEDAAEYFSIGPATLRGLEIRPIRIGRRVLYDRRDLDVMRIGSAA